MQKLYDDLTQIGSKSWVEALKIGALIEEVDIIDLQRIVANDVDNADLAAVYANLIKGSKNHLQAFVKNLKNQGVTYVPQLLTQVEYDLIFLLLLQETMGIARSYYQYIFVAVAPAVAMQ